MNYNITEYDYKNYILGSGWPSYKNISIQEMTDAIYGDMPQPYNTPRMPNSQPNGSDMQPINNDIPQNIPRYDTMPGQSRVTQPNGNDIQPKEAKLVKELYDRLNKILFPYVIRALDQYEYVNSPIYDEDGVDRETLAQLVAKVIELAEEEMDEAQEIRLSTLQASTWNNTDLFNSLIQALLLNEIFMTRRPRYRRARGNYVYANGLYSGIKAQ